jgi:WD40 repeat protein
MTTRLCMTVSVLTLTLVLPACSNGLRPGDRPPGSGAGSPATARPSTPKPAPTPGTLPALQRITLRNADKVQLLRTMDIPGYRKGQVSQCSLAFSPDGRLLVAACGVNQVPVWDVQDGRITHLLYGKDQQIVACAFCPVGDRVACGGFDNTITLWNPGTGEKIRQLGSHDSPIWDLDFSPDGQRLVSCSPADRVRLWDVRGGKGIWSSAGAEADLSVGFDPSGKSIAYGGRWGDAGVLDTDTGERRVELLGLKDPVGDVAYCPTVRLLAAGTDDYVIYLWNADGYQPAGTLKGHRGYVNGVSFSPDGALLASGSHDRTVAIWDLAGRKLVKMLEGHQDAVLRVAFSPDGALIASVSWDGTVRLWGVPGR